MPTPKTAPTTKRSARAKVPAEQKPTPKLSESAPPDEPIRKPREFTIEQNAIIDAVSDMLINGSDAKCLDDLVHAAARHQARTICLPIYDDPQQLEKGIEGFASRRYDTWRFEVETRIRANRKAPESERQTPADASGKIREAVRSQVIENFNNAFLPEATLGDLYLMQEVLSRFGNFSHGPDSMTCSLAEAFDMELSGGWRSTLLDIPDRHYSKVAQYAEALLELEGRAVAGKEV